MTSPLPKSPLYASSFILPTCTTVGNTTTSTTIDNNVNLFRFAAKQHNELCVRQWQYQPMEATIINHDDDDGQLVVYMRASTMLKFGYTLHNIIQIRINNSNSDDETICCRLRVKVDDDETTTLFISTYVAFHLGWSTHHHHLRQNNRTTTTTTMVHVRKYIPPIPLHVTSKDARVVVPTAQSVTLARVQSPDSNTIKTSIPEFRRFFTQHASIMCLGQVIAVSHHNSDIGDDAEDDDGDDDDDESSSFFHRVTQLNFSSATAAMTSVYYYVSKVEPPYISGAFTVNPESTSVITHGYVNSRVPKFIQSDAWCPPPDMKVHFDTLYQLVAPTVSSAASAIEPSILLIGNRRSGKRRLLRAVAAAHNIHFMEASAYTLLGVSEKKTIANLTELVNEAIKCAPILLHIRRLSALEHQQQDVLVDALRRIIHITRATLKQPSSSSPTRPPQRTPMPVVLVGSMDSEESINAAFRDCFTFAHTISVPDRHQRQSLWQHTLTGAHHEDMAETLTAQTAGLGWGDMEHLLVHAYMRAGANNNGSGGEATSTHFDHVLSALQTRLSLSSGTTSMAKIPDISWADIGGLEDVKRAILDTIELPLKYPQIFNSQSGVKQRSGVLLYGPPGNGKTLIAKAVANECGLNFISVKGPELLNMYVGESEKNIRQVFERARNVKPCILFFDEMDSLVPNRGHGSDGGGVMDRVVSQLLTELDGMDGNADIFIIGATNRPDLLDPALLRPGRLDQCVYLGVSGSDEEQLNIVRALTRKFRLHSSVDLLAVVTGCPKTLTGADLYALCSDALLCALKRQIAHVEAQIDAHFAATGQRLIPMAYLTSSSKTDGVQEIEVCMEDFMEARAALAPSLSHEELAHYERIRQSFTTTTTNNNNNNSKNV